MLRISRITRDNLRNGHQAVLRELRANGLFGASISDWAQSRGPDPIARQLGIGVTDFEMILAGLWLPAPSAAPSGDKPRARK